MELALSHCKAVLATLVLVHISSQHLHAAHAYRTVMVIIQVRPSKLAARMAMQLMIACRASSQQMEGTKCHFQSWWWLTSQTGSSRMQGELRAWLACWLRRLVLPVQLPVQVILAILSNQLCSQTCKATSCFCVKVHPGYACVHLAWVQGSQHMRHLGPNFTLDNVDCGFFTSGAVVISGHQPLPSLTCNVVSTERTWLKASRPFV